MASGKGDIFANEIFLHVLENENLALVGDATGLLAASTAGSVYVSLHKSATGLSAGDQETVECDYTDYDRVAVARTAAKWTTASKATENTDVVTFPLCGATGDTATHFAVGTDATGAGKILYWGALTAPLVISAGITPSFAAGALDLTEA